MGRWVRWRRRRREDQAGRGRRSGGGSSLPALPPPLRHRISVYLSSLSVPLRKKSRRMARASVLALDSALSGARDIYTRCVSCLKSTEGSATRTAGPCIVVHAEYSCPNEDKPRYVLSCRRSLCWALLISPIARCSLTDKRCVCGLTSVVRMCG